MAGCIPADPYGPGSPREPRWQERPPVRPPLHRTLRRGSTRAAADRGWTWWPPNQRIKDAAAPASPSRFGQARMRRGNLRAEGFRQLQYLPLPLEAIRRVLPGAVQVSDRRRGGVGGRRPGGAGDAARATAGDHLVLSHQRLDVLGQVDHLPPLRAGDRGGEQGGAAPGAPARLMGDPLIRPTRSSPASSPAGPSAVPASCRSSSATTGTRSWTGLRGRRPR
jgi:hypothetical protein